MSADAGLPGPSGEEFDVVGWLREHGRSTAISAAVILGLGLTAYVYVASENRKEAFASQALMQARGEAESGNLPLAATDLTRLVERFGGTHAADEAVILLNQIRLVQGQRDIAINALRQFLGSGHPAYIKASANALLAGALEDAGRAHEAALAYQEASRSADLDFLKAQYLIDAGRAFIEAKDTTAARSAYGEVLNRFGRLDQAAEARVRMAEIGGTVPPPPPPTDTAG